MTDHPETELSLLSCMTRDLVRDALRLDLDLDAFLTHVLHQAHEVAPFDLGWLLLREGDRLRIRAADEAHRGDVGMVFPLSDSLGGLSMVRGEPILIPDDTADAELRRLHKPSRSTAQPMGSRLVVPLVLGGDAIGALDIECAGPLAFTPRQVEMLRLLADHAALAIELARSRQEAAALGAISLQLARETELGDVVRTVLERALGLIGGRFGQILLLEGGDLVVYYTTNSPPRDQDLRFAVDNSVSGLAVAERRPVIVPDVAKPDYLVVDRPAKRGETVLPRTTSTPRYQRVLEREKERMRAELAVPLWSGASMTGILNVETPHEAGFGEEQRSALAEWGLRAGHVMKDAAGGANEATMRTLLIEALTLAGTTFGQLLAIDGEDLVIVATTGGEVAGTRVAAAHSVSGEVLARRDAHYVPDVDAEPRYHRYLGEEMKSELAVPLMTGDQVLGVLNLESPVPDFFTLEHARTLQVLAGQAAVAVERARRFEIERLAAIGGLAGDIVHRLNNPIGALGGWVEMLKRKDFYAELIAAYPYVEQFVGRAERDIRRAKSIIQELRTELKRRAPAPVSLNAAIEDALSRLGSLEERKIRVEKSLPDEPVRVIAGPSLWGIFWNLFDNAVKAMPHGGTLAIAVTRPAGADRITIVVSDTGVGIEPWRLSSIFEPGASTTSDSYAPAHGLGLWWTKGQIESFGGSIEATSERGAGTTFVLMLRTA